MGEPTTQEPSIPLGRFSLPRSLRAAVRSLKPHEEAPRGKPPHPDPRHKRHRARILAVGSALTLSALAVALLGVPDDTTPSTISGSPRLKLTEDGEFVRWRSSSAEITIDPSFEQLGPGTRDVVVTAYATWSSERAHLPALSMDMASVTRRAEQDGVNLVTYAPIEIAGHRQSLGVTVAYLTAEGTIVEVDTIINSSQPFEVIGARGGAIDEHDDPATEGDPRSDGSDSDEDDDRGYDRDRSGGGHADQDTGHAGGSGSHGCVRAYDLQSVVAHEAGHFFGLGEDQGNTQATMYYKTSRCDTKQRDLSDDDVAAVDTVYAEPASAEGGEVTQAAACAMAPGRRGQRIAWALVALLGALREARRVGARRSRAQASALTSPSK